MVVSRPEPVTGIDSAVYRSKSEGRVRAGFHWPFHLTSPGTQPQAPAAAAPAAPRLRAVFQPSPVADSTSPAGPRPAVMTASARRPRLSSAHCLTVRRAGVPVAARAVARLVCAATNAA